MARMGYCGKLGPSPALVQDSLSRTDWDAKAARLASETVLYLEGPTQGKCRIVGVEMAAISRSYKRSLPVLAVIPSGPCGQIVADVDSDVGQRLVVVVLE
jgi:hypothetical protein